MIAQGDRSMSLPALYTPEEAAAKLKVSRRAVYQWLADGRLTGLRAGQHWRIPEEELIRFMRLGRRETPVDGSGDGHLVGSEVGPKQAEEAKPDLA
jgi:excisionase family DNA binding protein